MPLHRRAAAATGRGVSGDLASAAAFLRRWGELVTDEEVIQAGLFWNFNFFKYKNEKKRQGIFGLLDYS